MSAVSRTLGPLHLEDLEPHRFEDLIRQLLYDFRPWKDLEATGRTGSDQGFDARAVELVATEVRASDPDDDQDDGLPDGSGERVWLVQCKREKAIGPKKIESYVADLPSAKEAGLYGLIFAAACDFSIEAREAFYSRARAQGFEEIKLWGKAEIEDQLYQPKNDHLLFAYFGVSLHVRRRSLKTEVRSRLAIKRKAKRLLQPHSSVLIRDASDDRYPFLDETEGPRLVRGRWGVWRFAKCGTFGIEVLHRRHLAYIDNDGVRWDFAERMNDAIPHDDPWPRHRSDRDIRHEDFQQWDALPAENKAWFEISSVLPYDAVIDIDEDGDDYFQEPHIYVQPFAPGGNSPFASFTLVDLSTTGFEVRSCAAELTNRMNIFPRRSGGDAEED